MTALGATLSTTEISTSVGTPTGITGTGQYDQALSLYNAKAACLMRWRKAFATQKTGGLRAHILCMGDSVTQGYLASEPFRTNSFPDRLRAMVEVWTGVTVGTGFVSVADLILTAGQNDWLTQSGTTVVAKGYASDTCRKITGTGQYVQIAGVTCDRFLVWYLRETDGGTLAVLQDGSAFTTFSTTGSEIVTTGGADVVGGIGSGAHTFKAQVATTTNAYIIGLQGIVGNTGFGVNVSRLGLAGRHFTHVSTAASLLVANGLNPDLTVITLGINDAATVPQDSLATVSSNATTTVQSLQASGSDVLLVVPPQPDMTGTTIPWTSYRQTLYDVALAQNCALLDLTDRWQGRNADFETDLYHPTNVGHADMARAIFDAVVAVT